VAAIVAAPRRAPLDILVVRKLGVPSQPELTASVAPERFVGFDPARIALDCGIEGARGEDHAAVLADLERGRSLGVVGSPHFVMNGVGMFCPGLEIGRVDGKLHIALDIEDFTSLVERCFGAAGS